MEVLGGDLIRKTVRYLGLHDRKVNVETTCEEKMKFELENGGLSRTKRRKKVRGNLSVP